MGFGPSLAPTVSTAVGCTLRLVRTNFNAGRTDLKVHRTSLKAWLKCCGVDREREREREREVRGIRTVGKNVNCIYGFLVSSNLRVSRMNFFPAGLRVKP